MFKQLTVIFTGLCAVAALSSGCASTWSLTVESHAEPMQWHDSSNTPIARQLATIKGFKETGTTIPNMLKNIVFGSRAEDTTIVRPVAIAIGPDNRIAVADIGQPCVHLYVPIGEKISEDH